MAQKQQSASMPAKKPARHPSDPRVLDRYTVETNRRHFGDDAELDKHGNVSDADATHALR